MSERRLINTCARLLSKLPFGRHPALFFNPGLEGYRNYTFGCRSGPTVSSRNLFHELGLAAQFGPQAFRDRATDYGFAFRTPHRVWVQGVPYPEPITMGQTQRELETFAYELHLMQAAGLRRDERAYFKDRTRIMRLMQDWYNVPGESQRARDRYCEGEIARVYHELDPKDVLARAEAWLDCTHRRLQRSRRATAAEAAFQRYSPREVLAS